MAGLRLDLPVDDEDYLVPSPQSPVNKVNTPNSLVSNGNNNVVNPYMDLLSADAASKGGNGQQQQTMFPYPPPQGYFLTGKEV